MAKLEKKIFDTVYDFIRLSELENRMLLTHPFMRLHDIRQLGLSYFIYPGATHTRFSHSIGVMELSSRIFNRIADQEKELPDERAYWHQIVRLAALCHDLGHLPFSHVAEKALLGSDGHEKWTLKVIDSSYLEPIWKEVERAFPGRHVKRDVARIAVGGENLSSWEKIVCEMVTGDFFGADRIDYLLRDAAFTGISYGLFDSAQLIESLRILEGKIGIEENGMEAAEALLLARYFMYRRVYQHPNVKALSFHLARYMQRHLGHEITKNLKNYLNFSDGTILTALNQGREEKDRDALALHDKSFRFSAVSLPMTLQNDDMIAIAKKLSLSEEELSWQIPKREKTEFDFPVLRENGSIVPAHECSELVIPDGRKSWAYITARKEKDLKKLL